MWGTLVTAISQQEVIEVRTLPPKMVQALAPFAPLFSKRIWQHAQLLLIGANPLLVCEALAAGSNLPGDAQASGI